MNHVEKLTHTILEIVKRHRLNELLAMSSVDEAVLEFQTKDYKVELLTDHSQAVVSISDSNTHYKVLIGETNFEVVECEYYNEQMECLTWETILYIDEEFWGNWFEPENNGYAIRNIGSSDVIVTAEDVESLTD